MIRRSSFSYENENIKNDTTQHYRIMMTSSMSHRRGPRYYHNRNYFVPPPPRETGYVLPAVDEVREVDDFDESSKRYQQHIDELKAAICATEKRLAEIQKIDRKVFTTISEYNDYLASEEKRRVIQERMDAVKKAEEDARAKTLTENKTTVECTIANVTKYWTEFGKCMEWWIDHDDKTYVNGNLIIEPYLPSWGAVVIDDVKELNVLLDQMKAVDPTSQKAVDELALFNDRFIRYIKSTHRTYNDYLVEEYPHCVDCPCGSRTLIYRCCMECDNKISWCTNNVNFLDDVQIGETTPVGYLIWG